MKREKPEEQAEKKVAMGNGGGDSLTARA